MIYNNKSVAFWVYFRKNIPTTLSIYETYDNGKHMIQNYICVISKDNHIMRYSFTRKQYIINNLAQ